MDFNNILVGSEDPARLVDFYTKLFGPHDQVHGPNKEPGRIIWNIESEDVKGDFERFRDAGATVVREPYNFEQFPDTWIATLADPDGNYFQLQSPFDPETMQAGSDR